MHCTFRVVELLKEDRRERGDVVSYEIEYFVGFSESVVMGLPNIVVQEFTQQLRKVEFLG